LRSLQASLIERSPSPRLTVLEDLLFDGVSSREIRDEAARAGAIEFRRAAHERCPAWRAVCFAQSDGVLTRERVLPFSGPPALKEG